MADKGQKKKDKKVERSPEAEALRDFEFGELSQKKDLDNDTYETEKRLLQIELLKVQRWAAETGQKIVALFEGRDAAGKGGTIKRFMEYMNPRGATVVALPKPSDRERGQWYFQRYVHHLPSAGEITLFDRSWYNRAGVEPVMGFCTPEETEEFLRQCPQFEYMLVRSGIWLVKYWLTVSRQEQKKRLEERETDPLKQWKLSPIDRAAMEKWDAYSAARDAMFDHTDTAYAPWTVVRTDAKKRARIACMRHFLLSLPYTDRDPAAIRPPDPQVLRARAQLAG
ncbi:MAG: polyphosphate kinase 2 [Alphaproteobacteria bacterium]